MRRTALLIVSLASLMVGLPIRAAESLFPVAPAVNTQRGFAVALDGVWLAVGAPQEEQEEIRNAGAVRLYRFETGVWIEKQSLASPEPQEKGRFGHSVAVSGLSLAVGAAGEGKVYIYSRDGDEWFLQAIVQDEEEVERLGQSVALDGTWLAIGAVDPNDPGGPGSVHLLNRFEGEWSELLPPLQGNPAAPDERFGTSVSLRGDILAVGAPGAEESKGAVYVFQAGEEGWGRVARRTAADGEPGDQLGFAVAVNANGNEVAAGAPTADAPGAINQGALYLFEEGEGWSDGAGGRLTVPGIDGGDHLGHSVSIDGNLLAAGAPFGSPGGSGAVHILIRNELIWSPTDPIEAGTAGLLDLFGYSVAVDGSRVAAGTVLLDQGGGSAGSAHTFTCNGSGCTVEGEAAASDQQPEDIFGVALDMDGDTLVVGAIRASGQEGVVYVYRRAGEGWRQEARLSSPPNAKYFGLAVAVSRDTLVVGAPLSGTAHLFQRMGEEWIPWATLTAPEPRFGDGFGRSVAIDGETVVIGAFGAAYVFEKAAAPGAPLLPPVAIDHEYGRSVAVSGDTVAVGAPFGLPPSVHLFRRTVGWAWESTLATGLPGSLFGWALAMDRGSLLIGAPYYEGSTGAAFLFEQGRNGWALRQSLSGEGLQLFGTTLDFHEGAAIVVGSQPFEENFVSTDSDIRLYAWTQEKGLTAQPEAGVTLNSPLFGISAAVSSNFFAVGVPRLDAGDRILIIEHNASGEVQP